jgi:hypothetical protein
MNEPTECGAIHLFDVSYLIIAETIGPFNYVLFGSVPHAAMIARDRLNRCLGEGNIADLQIMEISDQKLDVRLTLKRQEFVMGITGSGPTPEAVVHQELNLLPDEGITVELVQSWPLDGFHTCQ